MEYKCDSCTHKNTHIGYGPPDDYSCEYCNKGHWEGGPLDEELPVVDRWGNCTDYEQKENLENGE